MRETTIFFDIETGGLEVGKPIIQLAAIAVKNWRELDQFEVKIKFNEEDCDEEALKGNSYDSDIWEKEAIDELLAVKQFAGFLRRYAVVQKFGRKPPHRPYKVALGAGHNVEYFDYPRISHLFKDKHDQFLAMDIKLLDTYKLALWYDHISGANLEGHRLENLAQHFNIEFLDAHDALADVRMTARITRWMLHKLGLA